MNKDSMENPADRKGIPDNREYRTLLATDCGSTTTKAILVVRTTDGWRLAGRGEAPTTVEAPFDDVTVGVTNAIQELEDITGRRLLKDGKLICPMEGDNGVDAYFSTSSAGGGLQMSVVGVISHISGQSAERAALGAGAIVIDTQYIDDDREDYEQIESLRLLRPDIVLMAGGVNGGTRRHVEMVGEIVRSAQPRPRFGAGFRLPLIFAGNEAARSQVEDMLGSIASVRHVNNVRPELEKEDLSEARHAIHDVFLEHVMQQAPGYNKLMAITSADIMPTPMAVGLIIQEVAGTRSENVLAVDIGGATTDIFSVFQGHFHRTVSANYGMSYSLCNVMAESGVGNIMRWLPFPFKEAVLRDILRNKMIRPTTIPETVEELYIEQAAAREALRLSLEHHKALAVDVKTTEVDKDIGSSVGAGAEEQLVDMMSLELCIGSGGVLSHAPDRTQAALIMIDAFQLEGITRIAVDSIFMMPQLGVMSQLEPQAAKQVFDRDCLIFLGTVIAPVGRAVVGKRVMDVEITWQNGSTDSISMLAGDLKMLPLAEGEKAHVILKPTRKFDVGGGRGKVVEADVEGGTAGLILDARGRPLMFDPDPLANAKQRKQDYDVLGLQGLDSPVAIPESVPVFEGAGKKIGREKRGTGNAYTPGLTINLSTLVRKTRRLPMKGRVLANVGDSVEADTTIAQVDIPGTIASVRASSTLGCAPERLHEFCKLQEGEGVTKGDIVAERSVFFGLFTNRCRSPLDGTIEYISKLSGNIGVRGKPRNLGKNAYIAGEVVEVIKEEGVVVETTAAFIQGIFGIGTERYGQILWKEISDGPLTAEHINSSDSGKVLVHRGRIDATALQAAADNGVVGLVGASIVDSDLMRFLGYNIGVAITGEESTPFTLIVTEGFGDLIMPEHTENVLKALSGSEAAINGATQIRAGVIRPEIIVPRETAIEELKEAEHILRIGTKVRLIRRPHFGDIGVVVDLPDEPRTIQTGSRVRVLSVKLANGETATVPRANIEIMA